MRPPTKSMLLVPLQHPVQSEHSFELASAGAILDRQQWPARKVMQRIVEGEIGEENRDAVRLHRQLHWRIRREGGRSAGEICRAHRIKGSIPQSDNHGGSMGLC